jgi:hypothetical protein
MLRTLWNGLRYSRWTDCAHLVQGTMVVRHALFHPRPRGVTAQGEVWTICRGCGAVLKREREMEGTP